MEWWLAITALAVAALAYAYREHARHRRRLGPLFASIAEERGGRVTPGSLLVLPQLRFEQDGGRYLVTAMANSGAHDGERGPFTLVEVELPRAFEDAFRIRVGDAPATFRFLEARVREKLMASRLPRLEVRREGRRLRVHMDGIAASREEIEELIDIASRLARS
jgi:hypothetical protein